MEKGGDAGLITNRQRSALIVCQRLLFSTYIDTPSSISSGYMEETFLRQIFSPFSLAPESVALPANKWWPSRMAREWIESIGGAQRAFSPGGFFFYLKENFSFFFYERERRKKSRLYRLVLSPFLSPALLSFIHPTPFGCSPSHLHSQLMRFLFLFLSSILFRIVARPYYRCSGFRSAGDSLPNPRQGSLPTVNEDEWTPVFIGLPNCETFPS